MEDESWICTFSRMAVELPNNDDWTLEFAEELRNSLAEPGWKTHQQKHAFARFICLDCGHRWTSNHVLVFFRMKLSYLRPQKGSVKMYIFRQECKRCRKLCDATFMQENIEITLENLLREIRKHCYGQRVPGRTRDLDVDGRTTGPHRRELCEACINSVCPWSYVQGTSLTPPEPRWDWESFSESLCRMVDWESFSVSRCLMVLLCLVVVLLFIAAAFSNKRG